MRSKRAANSYNSPQLRAGLRERKFGPRARQMGRAPFGPPLVRFGWASPFGSIELGECAAKQRWSSSELQDAGNSLREAPRSPTGQPNGQLGAQLAPDVRQPVGHSVQLAFGQSVSVQFGHADARNFGPKRRRSGAKCAAKKPLEEPHLRSLLAQCGSSPMATCGNGAKLCACQVPAAQSESRTSNWAHQFAWLRKAAFQKRRQRSLPSPSGQQLASD